MKQSDLEGEIITWISLHVGLNARHNERKHAPCQVAPSNVMRHAQDDISYVYLVSLAGKLGGSPIVQAGTNGIDYGLDGESFAPEGGLSDRTEL